MIPSQTSGHCWWLFWFYQDGCFGPTKPSATLWWWGRSQPLKLWTPLTPGHGCLAENILLNDKRLSQWFQSPDNSKISEALPEEVPAQFYTIILKNPRNATFLHLHWQWRPQLFSNWPIPWWFNMIITHTTILIKHGSLMCL